jgi:transposase
VDAGQAKKAVAERFGISRPTLYKVLEDLKNGEIKEQAKAQFECRLE